ncbi:M10 family metallopeptidase [Gellertiella hungarica]|uniref:Serralysin n=1 Tax=Gellertiella hungarica TaxID=1572859 RepID=A0A7W6J2K0_9HYPH|nr:M10 family metallopeptidase [Gellertiella hungarica]MBB4063552.1 serralysin [Gellertiella hungarica]
MATNVLSDTQFSGYVNFLATDLAGGQLALGKTTISVNLDGLKDNAAQLDSALKALSLWSSATGLSFVTVTGATRADITFNNDGSGDAYTSWGGTGAQIQVSQDWMAGWPVNMQWGIGSYGLQTFVHEIGHALGLAHGGHYNGTGDYATDRLFDIDTWQYSVMSYYEQSNYTANGATNLFINGPMIADIAAIQQMYGVLAVNGGDTAYGAASTVMLGVTDFGRFARSSFTIHDTSGYDTINLSNAAMGSLLDLRPGSFSNVNGSVGNVAIATDTVIEQAIGSGFNDTLIGNTAANKLTGLAGADTLCGLSGNDTLDGGLGNDVIVGGAGNDTLIGGNGSDTLRGGAGDDRYYVDVATDIVDELSDGGAGVDMVVSSISFALGASQILGTVENLVLSGSAAINGTGNGLANAITGNGASNIINGAGGNDVLYGGAGNDFLTGGTGRDIFVFNTSPNSLSNSDKIIDFNVVDDVIYLENAVFTALSTAGALAAAAFAKNSTGRAGDSSDRVIYNSLDGNLYYDLDGTGASAGVKFATLTKGLALTASDFYVI